MPAIKEWLKKMLESTMKTKLTALIREKTISVFITNWKLLIYFLL